MSRHRDRLNRRAGPLAPLALACAALVATAAISQAAEPPAAAPAAPPASAPSTPAAPAAPSADARAEVAKRLGARLEDLRATPMPGVYELRRGSEISYVSADGKFLMRGDLYRLSPKGEYENLTEERMREIRRSLIADVPETQMLVFGPKNPRYTLTVFTDVDCTWCRRLHSQIADYNRLGIKVRYLFFPRSGPDTESWYKAEQVWCSANRQDAFNHAMRGEQRDVKSCPQAPIRSQYELGRTLGVDATPGLLLGNGELHMTYASPDELLKYLQAAR